MFDIIFYRDARGESDIVDYLDKLQEGSETNKSDRINRQKILTYIAALGEYGFRLGEPYIKHIEGDLWELRPLRNRIFFFGWKDNKIVLLHYFIKKTRKTPDKEKRKALNNMKDFLERN